MHDVSVIVAKRDDPELRTTVQSRIPAAGAQVRWFGMMACACGNLSETFPYFCAGLLVHFGTPRWDRILILLEHSLRWTQKTPGADQCAPRCEMCMSSTQWLACAGSVGDRDGVSTTVRHGRRRRGSCRSSCSTGPLSGVVLDDAADVLHAVTGGAAVAVPGRACDGRGGRFRCCTPEPAVRSRVWCGPDFCEVERRVVCGRGRTETGQGFQIHTD